MKTYSKEKLEDYQVLGKILLIHWDHKETPATEETESGWGCEEVKVNVSDSRSTMIEKVMFSKYSTGAELAAINNGGVDKEEYLTFRVLAKKLVTDI